MNQKEIKAILKQTLVDSKVSRNEKKMLEKVFAELKPDLANLQVYRNIAFDLARESDNQSPDQEVMDWLGDVMKILLNATQPDQDRNQNHHRNEVYFSPGQHCPRKIIRLLETSEKAIDICVFTITDDRITEAILAAFQRGVKLRVITDNNKSTDLGSDADRLLDAGVPVRFDTSHHHMHHKFAVFDQEMLLTGSYNWTRSAAENNEENFLVTPEPHFLKKYQAEFEKLWEKFQ